LTAEDDNLVLLEVGPQQVDKSIHLFLIHDGSGEVEGYMEFCKELNIHINCWGIRANRLVNYTPVNCSIRKMAAHYIEKIRKIQSPGPYRICGWSLGGIIAFEMAFQLESRGEKVSFLGLIDVPDLYTIEENDYLGPFSVETEVNLLTDFLPDIEIVDKLTNVSRIIDAWPIILNCLEQKNFSVEEIKVVIPEDLARTIPRYEQSDTRELIYYLNLNRTLSNAISQYSPRGKVNTTIHYLKASESPEIFKTCWNNYCIPGIKSYVIPGDHFSILKKPIVTQSAEIFSKIVKQIERSWGQVNN
jgi:thioesterase domain-containing protein